MPGGDRTGPLGYGPMTGRMAGFCRGYGQPGFENPQPTLGRGLGLARGAGFGRGRGWRHRRFATGWLAWPQPVPPPEASEASGPDAERQLLRQQVDILQSQLEQIQKRLGELDVSPRES